MHATQHVYLLARAFTVIKKRENHFTSRLVVVGAVTARCLSRFTVGYTPF